jgi:hypothetical protein
MILEKIRDGIAALARSRVFITVFLPVWLLVAYWLVFRWHAPGFLKTVVVLVWCLVCPSIEDIIRVYRAKGAIPTFGVDLESPDRGHSAPKEQSGNSIPRGRPPASSTTTTDPTMRR